ncbi:hypothetical protein HS088_TW16G00408 [Tripterygium wilfordii]|uniref:Uncharacterized protein n=1 Tax=Tripterygium wilfordii TaxID=458696 RepID=A0A7J7CIT8_TRIWF|nr:uncharacterized protein LOC119980295 isoform X1 [Tripterygium wilfordii]KAF5733967.1 hypothetical protein HS088_TW16G00408 [Tripterygium wilfordii]
MDDFSDEWKTMDDAAMKEKKSRHQMMGYRGLARRSRGSFDVKLWIRTTEQVSKDEFIWMHIADPNCYGGSDNDDENLYQKKMKNYMTGHQGEAIWPVYCMIEITWRYIN